MHSFRSTPRSATTLGLLLALTLLLAVATPRAGAAMIASSVSGFEGGPALASDGRVVVGERSGNGALRILAIDPKTGATTELAAFPPLADARTYPELYLSGSGGIVTGALDTFRQVGDNAGEQAQPTLLGTRTLTILPTLAALGACGPPVFGSFAQLDAAGGDGFVATVGDDCAAGASVVRLRTAGATVAIPARPAPAGSNFAPQISNLRASGPFVAWLETRMEALGSPLTSSVVVARAATGEVLLRTALSGLNVWMGLGADGTVAIVSSLGACAIGIVSPAAPALRRISLDATHCPNLVGISRGQGDVGVAGGRIVYASQFGYGVTSLQGGGGALAEALLRRTQAQPVAFDGATAFVVRRDCGADRLLAVDATAPVRAAGAGVPDCPVRRRGPARRSVDAGGRVTIALRCPAGCRGTLRLVQQRRGRRERLVGRADYATSANAVVVRPRLARYARALAGCSGGLRVVALLHPAGDDHNSVRAGRGKGLGPYRIVSRARCKRSGGPSFTAPGPGPRP